MLVQRANGFSLSLYQRESVRRFLLVSRIFPLKSRSQLTNFLHEEMGAKFDLISSSWHEDNDLKRCEGSGLLFGQSHLS